MEQSITTLRSRRNGDAKINALPRNLLQRVFDMAGEGGCDHKTTMWLSWVCAFWRDISHATPFLWHRIDLTRTPLAIANVYIHHNSVIPLEIFADEQGRNPQPLVEKFCIDHRDRIRTLNISLEPFTSWFMSGNLEAQQLESLTLRSYEHGSSYCVPDLIESGTKLRHLCLGGILLPPEFPAYEQLQSLRISLGGILAPESLDILSILRRAPLLEYLEICIPEGSDVFGSATRMNTELIPMLKLRQILLKLPSTAILHILSNISTTPSLNLRLEDTHFSESDILPLDIRCLPCISNTQWLRIDRGSGRFSMEPTIGRGGFLTYSSANPHTLSLSALSHIVLYMENVQELHLIDAMDEASKLNARDLVTFLHQFQKVESLYLQSCTPDILKLFTIHARSPGSRLCPCVTMLSLANMSLDVDGVVALCSSMGDRLEALSINGCSFADTEEVYRDKIKDSTPVNIQLFDAQFKIVTPTGESLSVILYTTS